MLKHERLRKGGVIKAVDVIANTVLKKCPFCGGVCKKCDCDEADCGRVMCTDCKGEFCWHPEDFQINMIAFNRRDNDKA